MPKRKSRKPVKPTAAATSHTQRRLSIIALIVALSMTGAIVVGWPMLGSGTNPGTSPAAPQSQPGLAKEYIYAGGRLVATDEPSGGGGGCSFSINPASQNFPSSGGSGSVGVSTQSGCNWTATSNAPWINITSGGSGSGNGTVNYSVASNPNPSPRTGTMTIAGQTFTVTQDPASGSCSFTINPSSQNFPATGGSGSVSVGTQSGCSWTATSNAGFITITSGASGSGSGSVNYSVASNPNPSSRTGTMTIAGQTFTVTQAAGGGGCTFTINPSSQNFSAGGGTGTVSVGTQSGCSWTATSNAPWIIISSGGSGSGNGTVNYSVASNPNPSPRTGTMTVAGQTFTVTQAAASGCTYSINPTSQNFPASGGSGSVALNTQPGCGWQVGEVSSPITITSASSGFGSATINYSVAANQSMMPRNLFIIIEPGQFFSITQAGCSITINPTSQNFTASGGSGNISVTTTSPCPWTAVSNDLWIVINSGGSGSGNGTVSYSVGVNLNMTPRTGTITLGGQTFTVTQDAGTSSCNYSISPTSKSFPLIGGTGMVSVTTGSGCTWTAVSNTSWIGILSGSSGVGNGTVSYVVGPNFSGGPRTGTITIAGQTFTVTQQ